jgi:hypothetical protein
MPLSSGLADRDIFLTINRTFILNSLLEQVRMQCLGRFEEHKRFTKMKTAINLNRSSILRAQFGSHKKVDSDIFLKILDIIEVK